MRITGGRLRGQRLGSVPAGVRPTSERVREALFAILGDVQGCRVLDLYAGTGGLGIEALSRGAETADFVDSSSRVRHGLRRTLARLALEESARIHAGPARKVLRRLAREHPPPRFDLVFLDPPYASDEIEEALASLLEGGLLETAAQVVIETASRHAWSLPPGPGALELLGQRRYGDTLLVRLRYAGGASADGRAPRPRTGNERAREATRDQA